MLDKQIRLASESLARHVNRRDFLKTAGGAIVTGVVALVTSPTVGSRGRRAYAAPLVPNYPVCVPPGPYCNLDGVNEPNACRGGSCFQHFSGGQVIVCHVDTMYQLTGCWTTPDGNGFWTCCDCICTGFVTCGCAQFTSSTGVFPD